MTLKEKKQFIEWARSQMIKNININHEGLSVEFFPTQLEPMNLDPKTLAEALSDSMPDDSTMLYASSEGIPDEKEDLQ
jgi:hypothetical protein